MSGRSALTLPTALAFLVAVAVAMFLAYAIGGLLTDLALTVPADAPGTGPAWVDVQHPEDGAS